MWYLILFLMLSFFLPGSWFWAIIIFFILVVPFNEVDIRYTNYRERRRHVKKRYSNHN